MRLTVFGLTLSSSWGNGHATLWRGLVRALARQGHRVTFFERDVPYYAAHRDLESIPDAELVLYADWPLAAARAFRRSLFSKELQPVGSREEGGIERPKAVSEYLLERLMLGGATNVNAWLSQGGSAWRYCAGESYVDVGTLHGYRQAIRLLSLGRGDGLSGRDGDRDATPGRR